MPDDMKTKLEDFTVHDCGPIPGTLEISNYGGVYKNYFGKGPTLVLKQKDAIAPICFCPICGEDLTKP